MRVTLLVCLAVTLFSTALFADADPCDLKPVMPPSNNTARFEVAIRAFTEKRCYENWPHDAAIRNTGPFVNGANYGTHPAVRIWYSPDVYRWMMVPAAKRKISAIKDGAIIVKEMFPAPASQYSAQNPAQVEGWTVMVRESKVSRDGWYWSGYFPGSTPLDPVTMSNTKYPASGFGNYCVNCHSSAQSESTFSDMRNIVGRDIITFIDDTPSMADPTLDTAPEEDVHRDRAARVAGPPLLSQKVEPDNELLHLLAPWWTKNDPLTYRGFPGETWDHVMAGKRGPEQFITSDQCIGCHDATGNIQKLPANMVYPASGKNATTLYNVSPYGEWRASIMGLAGRDPVFHSQMASELTLQPNPKLPTTIPNICFRCHGPMGQRQITIDKQGKVPFKPEMIYDWQPTTAQQTGNAKYGALARDSVSCTVCHHISDKGLGKPETYTGLFRTTNAKTIIGPFTTPQKQPMKHSLDMQPMHAEYIKESRLCGTCHTVQLPVLNARGVKVGEEFEQTTYFEWQNSVFQDEHKVGKEAQTCQQCHMPSTFKMKAFESQKLQYRIANIEDTTYPYADNRLPDGDLALQTRTDYARHTLVGINLFVQEMFLQYDDTLGIRTEDPMVWPPSKGQSFLEGLRLAEQATTDLAQQETATVEILPPVKTATDLVITVRVANKAGHSFPSGVSFRRAFIDFEVLAGTTPLWASGSANPFGMITNGPTGEILPTEFLENDTYQPHYTTIDSQSQVQIYEELVKSPEGHFTTSFLALKTPVKKNRLLPRGWKPDGPHAAETAPVGGAATDPDYLSGCGCDTVTYRIPLAQIPNATSVSASLYYQTIPPYYLRQRFTDTHVPGTNTAAENTRRLMDFVRGLNTSAAPAIANWKLLITSATQALTQ
jgi:mono/diheme cytochrome c family protein